MKRYPSKERNRKAWEYLCTPQPFYTLHKIVGDRNYSYLKWMGNFRTKAHAMHFAAPNATWYRSGQTQWSCGTIESLGEYIVTEITEKDQFCKGYIY